LGIGDWGLGPIPNPQSPIPPIPNPQKNIHKNFLLCFIHKKIYKLIKNKNI